MTAFHLSLAQVVMYAGAWILLDAIKAVCGHEVDWKPVSFLAFFTAGLPVAAPVITTIVAAMPASRSFFATPV